MPQTIAGVLREEFEYESILVRDLLTFSLASSPATLPE